MEKTKYDFGYKIKKDSTTEWAFNLIKPNSLVLELGPAIGTLTYNLKEEKGCVIDIVEIDVVSGEMAKRFARKACIGEDGNLNEDGWLEKLLGEKYDYIVGLDVFEHLDYPIEVLKKLKCLLSENGKLITSIPNIANNAVLLNLMYDKFDYTDLGLLDRTHRFFFTYKTIVETFENLEINIDSIDAIYKRIGQSEIECDIDKIPENILHFLEGRRLGDVYQYLLVGSLDNSIATVDKLKKMEYPKEFCVLYDGKYENHFYSKYVGDKVFYEKKLDEEKAYEVASFFPIEHACLIKDFNFELNIGGEWKNGIVKWISGDRISDTCFVFWDANSRIECDIANADKIRFECVVYELFDKEKELLRIAVDEYKKKENQDNISNAEKELNESLVLKGVCSILFNGLLADSLRKEYCNGLIDIDVMIDKNKNIDTVRFFPSDNMCVVEELFVEGIKKDEKEQINPIWINGKEIGEGIILFDEDEKSIELSAGDYDLIHIKCKCKDLDDDVIQIIKKLVNEKEIKGVNNNGKTIS